MRMKKVFWCGANSFKGCRGGIRPSEFRVLDERIAQSIVQSFGEQVIVADHLTNEIDFVGRYVNLEAVVHKYPTLRDPIAKKTGLKVIATLGDIVKVEVQTPVEEVEAAKLEAFLNESEVGEMLGLKLSEESVPAKDDKPKRGRPKKDDKVDGE